MEPKKTPAEMPDLKQPPDIQPVTNPEERPEHPYEQPDTDPGRPAKNPEIYTEPEPPETSPAMPDPLSVPVQPV